MMTTVIVGFMVAAYAGKRVLLCQPNTRQTDYLTALGLTIDAFLDPMCKCQPIIINHKAEEG